ncbi:protein Flattop homolog [Drosophila willistoni]|uniref:protein Flattop homolog n=1 Tax=Drosophila willistoni TaxID=7260 RepID=UPI00017D7EA4|nr:protein Flattop homolog [Drosophila willistoni]
MAFNFSANQFDQRFRAAGLSNWEYPRFSPPRPRSLKLNVTPVTDKNGHLLPTARRDGNSFGNFRGTYELPLRITRSFCARYDACLSGRYKFRDFPRDLCCCQLENQRAQACDTRLTLGIKGDPYWDRPKCQPKCEGVQKVLDLHERSLRCKRPQCILPEEKSDKPDKSDVSMPKSKVESGKKELKKKTHKRNVTAFPKTRKLVSSANDLSGASSLSKGKGKHQANSKSKPTYKQQQGKPKSPTKFPLKKEASRGSVSGSHKNRKQNSKTSLKDTEKAKKKTSAAQQIQQPKQQPEEEEIVHECS